MPNFETGGNNREYSQDEKTLLMEELEKASSQLLADQQKEVTQQLQSANVLYLQQDTASVYLDRIESIDGYDSTACDAFKEKKEGTYGAGAVVDGMLAIRKVQLLAVKACEHTSCRETDVDELLKKGIVPYDRKDQDIGHFDGLA